MKKGLKVVLIILGVVLLYLIIDFIFIINFSKPLLGIKVNEYKYDSLFYDVYNCPYYSVAQIKRKGLKLNCSSSLEIEKIIDKTKEKDFVCAEALEEFYEDENYKYYYSCIKSKYVIVKYKDGFSETVSEALKNGNITISDLDNYDIKYIFETKQNFFTRTYEVLNVVDSNDEKYVYITIRQFQQEEVETVKVLKFYDLEVGKNYEFIFKLSDKDIKDNIKSIFENYELINVVETNKYGLDQIQDELR